MNTLQDAWFHPFALLFIVVLIAESMWQFYLSWRQQRHVFKHREQIPQQFAEHINLSAHQKAANYTIDKQRFGRLQLLLSVLVTYGWTVAGGLAALQQYVTAWISDGFIHALALVLSFSVISSMISMPFGLYNTFVLEARHGFNRTTWQTYLSDALKGVLISSALGIPLLWVILWIMDHFLNQAWWLYAGCLMIGFQLLMLFVYPNYIAPLFNKFSPLEDQQLQRQISELALTCGFHANDIKVMDGSKRSAHGNAYFTGFGKTKKIVFFDTLLEKLSHAEVLAVLAHELGHFAHKHIIKRLALMIVMVFVSLFALDWLLKSSWFYAAFNTQASNMMALLLFSLIIPPFTALLTPIMAQFSRQHEFEADSFAAHKTSARDLISALLALYRDNASTLTPDPLYSRWYASHPAANERIQALNLLDQAKSA